MTRSVKFNFQERPEGNLMNGISRAWYEGLYPMMLVPIETPKLHVLANKSVLMKQDIHHL